jgi:hypothetical protein
MSLDRRCEEPSAIRINLGAIFVSLELSRSSRLITSLSPGAGERMSKHSTPAGDVGGLRALWRTEAEGARADRQDLLDRLRADGVAAVMSSGLGSVAENNGDGWGVYGARQSGAECAHEERRCAASRLEAELYRRRSGADMGGPTATLDVATSVRGVANAIARAARAGRGDLCRPSQQDRAMVSRVGAFGLRYAINVY